MEKDQRGDRLLFIPKKPVSKFLLSPLNNHLFFPRRRGVNHVCRVCNVSNKMINKRIRNISGLNPFFVISNITKLICNDIYICLPLSYLILSSTLQKTMAGC